MAEKIPYTTVVSADPAAGAEHSITAAEDLLVKSFDVSLVTDATVQNRQVQITVEDANGKVFFRTLAGGTQAASLTRRYSGREAEFAAPAVADNVFVIPLPVGGLFVPKGGKIKTATTLLQAGDNFGVLSAFAERLI